MNAFDLFRYHQYIVSFVQNILPAGRRYRLPAVLIAVVIIFLPALYADSAAERGSPFRVISSSEDVIVLKWELQDYNLVPVKADNQQFYKITGDFTHYHRKEGYPVLPYFSEIVGIPVDGDISLHLSNVRYRTRRDIVIYPAEKVVVKDGGLSSDYNYSFENNEKRIELTTRFHKDRNAYRSSTPYPANPLQKGVKAFAADRRFASFIFSPFQYYGNSKSLHIISEATLTIRISGDKTKVRSIPSNRSYIDRAGDLFFINNEHSRHWRKPRNKDTEYIPVRGVNSGFSEIQIVVDREGIYRITYQDLIKHIREWREEGHQIDFDINRIDPRFLELSSQFGVTPIHFQGERNGSFDSGDYFEFFGERNRGENGYSDAYTGENVYTLKLVDRWGARMAVESGGIRETNPRNYIQPISFEQTVHFEEQNTYSSLSSWYNYSPPYREDLWFWKVIRAPDLSVTPFRLEYPHDTYMRGLNAKVCLVGSTDLRSALPDHHARVRINSAFIEANKWHGQREQIFENRQFTSNHYLNHGINYLYVDLPGDTPAGNMEAMFLDYFTLTYWREYKTDTDYIKFTKPSHRPLGLYNFQLENFSSNDVYVYKKNASIIENLQIEPFSETGAAPYTVTFQDVLRSHDTEYIALTGDKKLQPKKIRPRFPSDLKNPANAADYIIVTVREFMDIEGTNKLRDSWTRHGYSVKIVDIQNIFDEFNYGIRSAYAMKDFFKYAYNNWQVPFTDVLLLGKGIFDERDFSVHRDINHIPYRNVWTNKVGATPSDNWFACIVGDDFVPDFNIARITAWTEEQVLAVAQKTVLYKESPNYEDLWQSRATLVAGGQAGDEDVFARQNERIRRRWIPEDFDVTRVYSRVITLPGEYQGGTFRLRDSWNTGTSYIQFMGHGGGRIWADYNLLNNRDIATLNNRSYPFVNSLSCYPSDFSRPGAGSIGENMVLTAGRAAIAHFGFSGLGYLIQDEDVGMHLTEAIFYRDLTRFGDIVSFTKAKTYATLGGFGGSIDAQIALVQSALLFGDPMLEFNLPRERVEVELNKYNITEEDTLRVRADMGQDILFARLIVKDSYEITENVPFDLPVINGIFNAEYIIPESREEQYSRTVFVHGYGDNRQVLGKTRYTVGQAAVVNNVVIPAKPTPADSIRIAARFFDEHGIQSVRCIMGNESRGMVYDAEKDRYITSTPFQPRLPRDDGIRYRFVITNGRNREIETEDFTFRVVAPDLEVNTVELSSYENKPAVRVLVRNTGDYKSGETSLNLYQRGDVNELLNSVDASEIPADEERWFYVPIPPLRGNFRFRAYINEDGDFTEHSTTNNVLTTGLYSLNMFYAGVSDTTVYSLDGNLKVEFPANLFPDEEVFFINSSDFQEPLHQPDAHRIPLLDNSLSTSYQIGTFNESILGSETGMLPDNKRIKLTMNYSLEHPQISAWHGTKRFSFFRWEAEYKKWINQGGERNLDTANRLIFLDVNRLATYTILHNTDTTAPTIRANVQDQEFTFGGYIAGTGVISLMLSDANGIDIFDRKPELYLNGERVPETDYTIAANPQNLTSVPVKYQLNLKAGNYSLLLSCSDVNGNRAEHTIHFIVSTTFDVINLANYPNPVITDTVDPVNANRTRFTYVLTDDADNVKIKIYTVSGRLVKTFDHLPSGVGYHEYPRTVQAWDCRDDKGVLLSNGIYFYKIIAEKNGKSVERVQKMAIAR